MMKRNRVMSGALFAFALLAGPMAHADDEKPVSLIVPPKAGRVTRAKTIIKSNLNGADLLITQTRKDTVKAVKENGDFIVEITDEGTTINFGGTDQEGPAMPPQTITRDKVNKIKEMKTPDANPYMAPEVSQLMVELATAILTDKPVKAKDTWQTELDNPAVKEKKITVKDTYLGPEKIDGKDYWKIKQTAEAIVDTDGSKMTYEITQWIDPADGSIFKIDGTLKDIPTTSGPLTMQITSTAIKAADKSKAETAKP